MAIFKFILRSFWYFRKQHLAVLAGTIISTAVLTGALIVGDSVKFSLRQIVDARLGSTKFALQTGERFVRSELSNDISNDLKIKTAPLLHLNCIAINSESNLRINKAQIYGVDQNFWQLSNKTLPDLNDDEIIVSENVAEKLDLKINDEILLRVENANVIPLNAPFAKESDPSVSFRVIIKEIANDQNLGRFGLKNIQSAPYNIFISRDYLAKKLEVEGLSNVIIASNNLNNDLTSDDINYSFEKVWKLKDAGLLIRELEDDFEILSDRIFIDNPITESINKNFKENESILTYLVNSLRLNNRETPYSFVSAASSKYLNRSLAKNEIIINQWLADDIVAKKGDTLELDYYIIGPLRTLEEKTNNFIVKDILPTQGGIFDRNLMPLFPGLADAGSCSEWDTGIPIDLDRIRDKDEKYWDEYKGTPKAFITIESGLELWQNKYGNYTSVRLNKNISNLDSLKKGIISVLDPKDLNLFFLPVQAEAIRAASSGVDFGELFLSMSFFVIVAGILLTVLIYSLNTESRNAETGILSGLGFHKKKIIKIRFIENIITVLIGGIIGALFGILYNRGIMHALNNVWQDIVRTNMLSIYIKHSTLLIGTFSGIVISLLSIYLVTRKKLQQPIIGLIRNGSMISKKINIRENHLYKILAILSYVIVALVVIYSLLTSLDQNANLILSVSSLFLLGSILWLNLLFNNSKFKHSNSLGFNQLAFKNAAKNKGRSLAIIALLSLGTFTIIITGANRKTFYESENKRESGTGGFQFWAETTLPILNDLNSEEGKNKYNLTDEPELEHVNFVQIHQLDGDDASCLNLNQINNPKILGLNPEELNNRKSFSFARLLDNINKIEPWLELNKTYGKNIIPAYADQTVITWGLMKNVGDTLIYLNEKGEELYIVLAGGLQASIFQGSILIADKHFSKHFPSVSGSKTILVDSKSKEKTSEILSSYLRNYGIELTQTSERLSQFYSVTNTYLTVFMFLGGLGVIIGTIGLGIVLLRNILERKSEIALLLSLGFSKLKIIKLIVIENIILLLIGLKIGIGAALIGILPSLLSESFNIPSLYVIALVLIITISGLLWIYLSTRFSIKSNLIVSLRNE